MSKILVIITIMFNLQGSSLQAGEANYFECHFPFLRSAYSGTRDLPELIRLNGSYEKVQNDNL